MIAVIPFAVICLAGGAFWSTSKRPEKGVMKQAHQLIFQQAIDEVKDVNKLKALAKAFREQGLIPQADLLEKRARLRELPPEIKAARKDTFRRAMSSSEPKAVRAVANAFEKEGANGAANALRSYADSLVKKQQEITLAAPSAKIEVDERIEPVKENDISVPEQGN